VVIEVVITAVDVVDVGMFDVETIAVVVAGVVTVDVIEVFVVVEEEHDANTSDVTIRQVSVIQMIPLFIFPPIYILFSETFRLFKSHK
jgi:hypothetical protein